MPDFQKKSIEVRYYSTSWGPHNFDFIDAIPLGTRIEGFNIRAFLGKYDKGDDLAAAIETTLELIDANMCIALDYTTISTYFNCPTTVAYKSEDGVAHTIIFELTLNNGATHPFYFHQVVAYE